MAGQNDGKEFHIMNIVVLNEALVTIRNTKTLINKIGWRYPVANNESYEYEACFPKNAYFWRHYKETKKEERSWLRQYDWVG